MSPNNNTGDAAAPAYPYTWSELSEAEKADRRKLFSGCQPSCEVEMVRASPGGVLMPEGYARVAQQIYNFKVRPDDIWIVTYPKCGTTWTQVLSKAL